MSILKKKEVTIEVVEWIYFSGNSNEIELTLSLTKDI